MKRIIALMLSAGVAGCAQPTSMRPGVDQQAVEAERNRQLFALATKTYAQQEQLAKVNYAIAHGSPDLCGTHVRALTGAFFISMKTIPERLRDAAKAYYPFIGDYMSIRYVVPGSPGDKGGLKAGDTVISVNGKPVPPTSDEWQEFFKGMNRDSNTLVVQRDGAERTIRVFPEKACSFQASIKSGSVVNAYADGEAIYVTEGMMDFIHSDEELAVVLGHELAHNLRGHLDAKRQNELGGRIAGAVLDGLVAAATRTMPGNTGQSFGGALAAQAYSVDFEAEADYVGLYLMARAGFPIKDAPDFWRRMGAANPKAVTLATTHPSTPERFVALKATQDEIEAKKAKGEPLVPNEKQPAG